MVVPGLQVLPCPLEDRRPALEVLYQNLPRALRGSLIAEILNDGDRGLVDLSGLWIARRRGWGLTANGPGRIVAALMTQGLNGRAAAIWAPEVRPSWRRAEIAAQLVHEALEAYKARGFAIAQAVLDESSSPRNAADLARGGMPRITDLLYLHRDTATPLIPAETDRRLAWQGLGEVDDDDFRRVVEATYAGSLDMPELEGARTLDDTLDGHRGAGRFVPEQWLLGRVPGRPDEAAVLMLAAAIDREAWEVVYLGLTPEARGHGLGTQAIAHALDLARPHAGSLELAVDVRNRPAVKLYGRTGFVPHDRRAVHLAVFPNRDERPPCVTSEG
ncbi:GNAT family N-acetyltransferase [Paludisphaera borealis]|uniref:Mycothiol acetyltransferase n=1 Tax=Paludisphaera borealis TaxID=1387353 RepID=A0A1U7CSJ4_9BACT|nr:GNAT family N-acetyltransferase [Paludisphaera borealis]APW61878.1 Mycothiol acetyltransferase [Paludisphaera borealis]